MLFSLIPSSHFAMYVPTVHCRKLSKACTRESVLISVQDAGFCELLDLSRSNLVNPEQVRRWVYIFSVCICLHKEEVPQVQFWCWAEAGGAKGLSWELDF